MLIDSLILLISILIDVPTLLTIALLLWIIAVEYTICDLKNRSAFLLFLISFFVFLMGSEVAVQYLGYPREYVFSEAIDNHAYICLCISLLGLMLGFALSSRVVFRRNNIRKDTDLYTKQKIRMISKRGMVITAIPYIAEAIDSGIYVLKNNYLAYYVSYSSSLPSIVTQLSELYTMFLFMYLATMPEKKKCKAYISIYLIYGIIMLMTGRRLYFGIAIFTVAAYILIRHKRNPEEKWITDKLRWFVVIVAPVTIILLYAYKYVRYDLDVVGSGYIDLFVRFFDQQGFTINVIKFAKQYGGENLGITSLYYTLKFLRSGVLTRWFFSFPVEYYKMRNAISALNINSLADYVMYNYNSYQYSIGYGLGTSYIAELYHDGGYFLLFFCNIFYGIILSKLFSLRSENVWRYTFALMMLEQFMVLPRYGADAIFRPFYNLTKMVILLAVFLFVKYAKSKTIFSTV